MKAIRVRSDFTVKLPKELRGRVRPGDRLSVELTGAGVAYTCPEEGAGPSLREILERVRANPAANPPSAEEIEELIHQVRQERR